MPRAGISHEGHGTTLSPHAPREHGTNAAIVESMRPASRRILECIDALDVVPGTRVLEIGCGPGVAARELVRRGAQVLAIDRSAVAIRQAMAGSALELATGRLRYVQASAEAFTLAPGERLLDIAVALRVGALDGRHPEAGLRAVASIRRALVPGGRLFIDGGDPLREVSLTEG